MSQNRKGEAVPSAVRRAEQLLDTTEQRIKFLFANAGQFVQHTVSSQKEKASPTGQPSKARQKSPGSTTKQKGREATQPAMERAEKVVGRMGERFNALTAVGTPRLQRITARMRENTEDLWAEIQHVRHARTHQ